MNIVPTHLQQYILKYNQPYNSASLCIKCQLNLKTSEIVGYVTSNNTLVDILLEGGLITDATNRKVVFSQLTLKNVELTFGRELHFKGN